MIFLSSLNTGRRVEQLLVKLNNHFLSLDWNQDLHNRMRWSEELSAGSCWPLHSHLMTDILAKIHPTLTSSRLSRQPGSNMWDTILDKSLRSRRLPTVKCQYLEGKVDKMSFSLSWRARQLKSRLSCIIAVVVAAQTVRLLFIRLGGSATLSCLVDTARCGDYHSIKWYRDGIRVAVFSNMHTFRSVYQCHSIVVSQCHSVTVS